MKPLFIPLKREFFEAFARGEKTHEYRVYGARWNPRTCRVGRAVTLSLGYGKASRLTGVIVSFTRRTSPPAECLEAWLRCYGSHCHEVADIEIKLEEPNGR